MEFPGLVLMTETCPDELAACPERPEDQTPPSSGESRQSQAGPADDLFTLSKLPMSRILDEPMPVSNEFQLNITGMAEYLACPRRYYLEHIVGLPVEAPAGPRPMVDGHHRYLREQGIIFHALLERMMLGQSANREKLLKTALELAQGQGWSLSPHDYQEITAKVEEFLDSDWGRPLAANSDLLVKREMPVWLQVGKRDKTSPVLTLTGEVDLFYVFNDRQARVLDYKYTEPKDSLRYQAQLKTYALALLRAGISSNLEAALYYANPGGTCRLVQVPLSPGWEEEFEAQILEIGRTLAVWQQGSLVEPVLPVCPNLDCELQYACKIPS